MSRVWTVVVSSCPDSEFIKPANLEGFYHRIYFEHLLRHSNKYEKKVGIS